MIKSLEGARGLAAVFVSLFHFGLAFYVPPIEYGYLFVDLFFVLSGFVITATYSQRITQLADLKPFLIRRFGRLFPLMVFATALYVLVFNLGILAKYMLIDLGHTGLLKNPDALAYMVPGMAEIGGTMVLVQGMGLFDHLILNKVSWSISVEFYTYLLFAVLWVALAGKSRVMVSVALAVAGIGVTIWATLGVHDCLNKGFCYDVTYDFGFARCIGAFFLGAFSFQLSKYVTCSANKLQALSLFALLGLFACIKQYPLLAFAFPCVFAMLVVSICRDSGFVATFLKRSPLQVLGQRSFSIYMLHPVVLLLIGPAAGKINRIASPVTGALVTLLAIAAYIALIVVIAGWSYARIESPSRAWFGRLAEPSRKRATPAAGPTKGLAP
jgi:peptidoglycan/LPS O-acetylase OafA/YrhL